MKITSKFLKYNKTCDKNIIFAKNENLIGLEDTDFISKLIELGETEWANWLTVKILWDLNKVKYAIFAAEQAIDIYEKEYPDNSLPRNAITAAKIYINNPNKKNIDETIRASRNAANAAYTALDSKNYSAYASALASVESTHAAIYFSENKNICFDNYKTPDSAAHAADYARIATSSDKTLIKIIQYGICLIKS